MVSLGLGRQPNPSFAFGVSATDSVQRKYTSAERDCTSRALFAAKDISAIAYDTLTNGKHMYQQIAVTYAGFFPQRTTHVDPVTHHRRCRPDP
jgi:hypothetical protein